MADFVEKLIIDDSEAIKPLKNLQSEMDKTVSEYKKMQGEINAGQKSSTSEIVGGQQKIAQALQKTQDIQRKTGNVFKYVANESATSAKKAYGVFGTTMDDFGTMIQKLKVKVLESVNSGLAVYGTSIDDLSAKAQKFKTSVVNAWSAIKKGFGEGVNRGLAVFGTSMDDLTVKAAKFKEIFGTAFQIKLKGMDSTGLDESRKKMSMLEKAVSMIGAASGVMGNKFFAATRLMAAGIAATGIGALLIALVSLITFFGKTERGAMLMQRAMGAIGAATGVLTKFIGDLGEKIYDAFSSPKEAVKELWDAIQTNLINRIKGIPVLFAALGKVIKSGLSLDWEGVKQGSKDVGTAVLQMASGFDKAQQSGIKGWFSDLNSEIRATVGLNDQLIQREQAMTNARMESAKAMAEQDMALSRLNAQLSDSDTTLSDRLKIMQQISSIEQSQLGTKIKFAREEYDIALKRSQLPGFENMKEEVAQKQISLYGLISEAMEKNIEAQNKLKETIKGQAKVFDDTSESLFKLARQYNLKDDIDEWREGIRQSYKELEEQKKILTQTAESIDKNKEAWEKIYGKDAVTDMRENIETQIGLLTKLQAAVATKLPDISLETVIKRDNTGLQELEKELAEQQMTIDKYKEMLANASDKKSQEVLTRVITNLERQLNILKAGRFNRALKELKQQLDEALKIQADNPDIDLSVWIKKLEGQITQELHKSETGKVYSMKPSVVVLPDITYEAQGKVKITRTVTEDVQEYLSDVDTAEQLFDKAMEDIFGKAGAEKGKEMLSGLGAFVSTWGAILNEAQNIRIREIDKILDKLGQKRAKLEEELDHELELQRQGLANNVGNKKAEVDVLIAEEERLRVEREKIQKAAERRQILSDTAQQTSSLITASIQIIKGFSHIPVVGLGLGIAAVAALFGFFAKTKLEALKATKLYTGAAKISDHFGYAKRGGETDLPGRGDGYRLIDERTGTPTNVIISGREMLVPERISQEHEAFFNKLRLGMYSGIDLNTAMNFYKNFKLKPAQVTLMQPKIEVAATKHNQRQFIPIGNGKWSLVTITPDMKDGTTIEIK